MELTIRLNYIPTSPDTKRMEISYALKKRQQQQKTEHIESIATCIHMHTVKNSVLFEVTQLPSILISKYHVQELSQIICL